MNTTNGLHFFLLLSSLSSSPVEQLPYFSVAYQTRNYYDHANNQYTNIQHRTEYESDYTEMLS